MTAVRENTLRYAEIIRRSPEGISPEELILASEKSPSTFEKYKKFIPIIAKDISYNENRRLWISKE